MLSQSDWWGVWLVAKTESEKDTLVKLKFTLPISSSPSYEQGQIRLHTGLEWKALRYVNYGRADIDDDDVILELGR